jgi:hypothetical protein
MARLACGVSIVVLATGCASMVSGTSQTVYIQALDQTTHQLIPSATCVVRDQNNTYTVRTNPGSLVLRKGQGLLQTKCQAPGYVQNAVGVVGTFNPWVLGNIIFPPAVVVDLLTGADEKYPDHITVLMTRNSR